jgi:RES domain-containing protein
LSGALASIGLKGTWWRHARAGAGAWERPREPFDGRWQRGAVVEALYFADSPETAWAEWYRYLAEAAMPPEHGLPRDLWRWGVDLDDVVDLRSTSALAKAGIGPLAPTRAQWPLCQRVGEELFAAGQRALIAPSAARPGWGEILCVFRTESRVEGLTPSQPPERHRQPPPPPPGLRT